MLSVHLFNLRPRSPLLISRFVVMSFFIEDSAIRFLSCPFTLELYYSLHSFCIFWSVFFFCLHFHTLPLFVFLFHYVLCSVGKTNKQKKKPPRKAVLFHEYQASTGRSNKFLSLLAASVCFFMITASGRACVFVCMSFYYRPPIRKCASWYC